MLTEAPGEKHGPEELGGVRGSAEVLPRGLGSTALCVYRESAWLAGILESRCDETCWELDVADAGARVDGGEGDRCTSWDELCEGVVAAVVLAVLLAVVVTLVVDDDEEEATVTPALR